MRRISRRRRARTVFAVIGGLIVALNGLAVRGEGPASPVSRLPSAIGLLDKYAEHRFDVVTSVASLNTADAEALIAELDLKGLPWTQARGAAAAPGRRLVAATFALDLARAWGTGNTSSAQTSPSATSAIVLQFTPRWDRARKLVAWGCQLLRTDATPQPSERLWHLTAVALLQGMQDSELLTGNGAPGAEAATWWPAERATGHLAHATSRFPDESRFLLAEAVAEENRTARAGVGDYGGARPRSGVLSNVITADYLTALTSVTAQAPPTNDMRTQRRVQAALVELGQVESLRALPRSFEALARHHAILAEVNLRSGYVALRLSDIETGLKHLRQVDQTTDDKELIYIARLLIGSAFERIGQMPDAATAYRAALDVAPRARTASALLTSVLMRDGRAADANDQANHYLGGAEGLDPWRVYRTGDYRLLARYFEQLKMVLP